MIDFNTRLTTDGVMSIEPGDILDFALAGTGGDTVDRIRYEGEPSELCIGQLVTVVDTGNTYVITDFGTNIDEDEIAIWARPAAG
jgi:hypothetical protein